MKDMDLQNSRKAWAAKALSMLAITFSAGAITAAALSASAQVTAHAEAPAKLASHAQTMTYEVYAGGINAVQAELDVIYQTQERYRVALAAQTKGFLGKLVPWSGTFETNGWRKPDGTEQPELHKSTAIFDSEEDIKEYNYGKDGSFKSLRVIEAGKDETPESLDDELVQGTTDALTATLNVMQSVAESGKCEGEDEVFDGKRRFKMVFRHVADDMLTPTEYNVYEGQAARCEVEVVPMTGEWHEKPRGWASIQEQGREKGSLPTFWLAKIDEQGPAVPVKLRVKTDYGTLFMHLVEYKNGERVIQAKK